MNVASKELCQELFEVSGWKSINDIEKVWCHGKVRSGGLVDTREVHEHIPAYDLGWLLRKLQMIELDFRNAEGFYPVRLDFRPNKGWYCGLIQTTAIKGQYADTPEDAACLLAIELFKQGVLTK